MAYSGVVSPGESRGSCMLHLVLVGAVERKEQMMKDELSNYAQNQLIVLFFLCVPYIMMMMLKLIGQISNLFT